MIKGLIHQEDSKIMNSDTFNNIASKYTMQMMV